MIILAVILALVVLLVAWIIFVPVLLIVNTRDGRYEVEQKGTFLFKVALESDRSLKLYIMGVPISMKKQRNVVKKEDTKKRRSSRWFRRRSVKQWRLLVNNLIKSLRLRRLYLNLDTGDVITNAKMIPVCYMFSRRNVMLKTNFEGIVHIELTIAFFLYKAIWAFIQFIIKH